MPPSFRASGTDDRAAWKKPGSPKEIPGPRQREAERLVAWDVLDGMTRGDVLSMLGTRGLLRHPRSVEYRLGVVNDVYLDADWLEIHFGRNDRVTRIDMGKNPGELAEGGAVTLAVRHRAAMARSPGAHLLRPARRMSSDPNIT